MLTYKIADITVGMDIKYDRLKKQAQAYLFKTSNPDIVLSVPEKATLRAKEKFKGLDDGEIEYLLMGALFYDKLLDFDGLMLHSSAVAVGNTAYLFSADSGVGKSTHTDLWTKCIDGAVIVNDDKPAIRSVNGQLMVYGTPFSGKYDKSINKGFLLGGICFIERGQENFIEETDVATSLPLFLKQSPGMLGEDRVSLRLSVTDKILSSAKLYKMKCNTDISAAKMSYDKMNTNIKVSLDSIFTVMEEMLSLGKEVTFATNGDSMRPLLLSGESVTLKRFLRYKKGDVILFRKNNGNFVLHRIIKIKNNTVFTQGDALISRDEPFDKERIIGKAVAFIKKDKTVHISNLSYLIYKTVYMSDLGRMLRRIKRKFFKK